MTDKKESPEEHDVKQSETRREFIKRAGLATGGITLATFPTLAWGQFPRDCTPRPTPPPNPTPFRPDTSLRVRLRKSAFTLTRAEIDKLRAAYRALRALPADDPRTWMLQANVHCFYCGGASGNSQPEIHGGWWFFPWHRAYLYFHERILGSLIGDMTLTLPYWDWDAAGRRTLPPPYTAPNNSTNSLFDARRGASPTQSLSSSQVGPSVITPILNTPDFETFGGTDPDDPNGQGGNLEFGPHGLVHIFVGDPTLRRARADMGLLQTAAQDPVFYSHHCNIDRLWDVWTKNSRSHRNPTDSSWLNQSWNFYDENKQWRSIKVSDVINMENSLRITYGTRVTRPPLGVAAGQARPLGTPQQQVTVASDPATLTPDPQTKQTELPAELRNRIVRPQQGLRARKYILHIEGIEVPTNEHAIVRVFVNLPNADASTSIDVPNYIGYFTEVGKTEEDGHRHKPLHATFNITAKMRRLLAGGGGFSVTLVPVTAEGKPEEIDLKYKKIYISEH